MQKDSALKTIMVAVLLCIVCSVAVSFAAVFLKDRQEKNKQLDIKKNLLSAAGLLKDGKASEQEVLRAYQVIKAEVVDLASGDVMSDMDPDTFDQRKAAKNAATNREIPSDLDAAGIKRRSKYSVVYKVSEPGSGAVKMLVLPINGKGLWSTLYGFIALDVDTRTVRGIGFYEHGETPGLGGEVDNPLWKKQWVGKVALDDQYRPVFKVIKGQVDPNDSKSESRVDGLSGATITSNGVTGLVNYWLGEDGFGPYLEKFRQSQS